MPKLLIRIGEKEGFVFRLTGKQISIGRDPTNTLVLPDRRVSRRHVNIIPEGEGYVIEDLESVNGSMVNGSPIKRQLLKLDDEIKLGATTIGFLSLDASEEIKGEKDTSQLKIIPEEKTPKGFTVEMTVIPEEVKSVEGELAQADLETLQKGYERLGILYRVSYDLGTIIDVPKLLDKILELVFESIKADRGFIALIDEETGGMVFSVVRKREGVEDEDISVSKTIIDQVKESGEAILTSDAMQDDRFKDAHSIIFHGIRSTMCVPIKHESKLLGIMQVDTKGKVVSFTKDDLELLTAICNQAAVAIDNAKLFDGLKKANEAIKAQQAQLIEAEKLSAMGRLAGGVAHEINNPMTSILGYSELTSQQLTKENLTPEELKECAGFVKIVEEEAHHCKRIAQSLLQFGRRKKSEMTPVDVNKVIEATLTMAQFHMKKVSVEIKKELTSELSQITGDAGQLQQVFLNFVVNAKDAMEQGGVLTISTSKPDDKWIEVEFIDTGCGIPEDKLEEIFKPLYTSKEEGKGTGLGLSISQDIIDRHKGTIEVASTVGKGTTFTIKLPVA